jgi:hypothetical protein
MGEGATPFRIDIPEANLEDLRGRLARTGPYSLTTDSNGGRLTWRRER